MRRLFLLASTFSLPLSAHPGHGATPAHVHAHGAAVDVGALVFVVALGVFALVAVARAQRASDKRD